MVKMPPLRFWVGPFLAIEWNLPLLLLFWYGWKMVLLGFSANCLLWSAGLLGFVYSTRWRNLFFRQTEMEPEARRRCRSTAAYMLFLGCVSLVGSFFERK